MAHVVLSHLTALVSCIRHARATGCLVCSLLIHYTLWERHVQGGTRGLAVLGGCLATLFEHLDGLTHRDFRGVATRLGVRQRLAHDRGAWIASISAAWRDPAFAAATVASLSPAARAALARFRTAGSFPEALFLAEYGPLRRAGPGRTWQPPPWRQPSSAAEELFYVGLLSVGFDCPDDQAVPRVSLPADVSCPEGTAQSAMSAAPAASVDAAAGSSAFLIHDVGQWLIFLATAHPALQHGRWLRGADLDAFNRRLVMPRPSGVTHATDPWLAFLAFLATAGGLSHDGAATAFAWSWLALDPQAQRQHLWSAWLAAPPQVAQAYRQPGAPLPAPWPHVLVEHLPPPGVVFTPPDLTDTMLGRRPDLAAFFVAHFPDLASLDRVVGATLAHPLTAFGAVRAIDAGSAAANEYVAVPQIQSPAPASGPSCRVALPELPAEAVELAIPWDARLAAQAGLALFAEYLSEHRHDGYLAHVYRLTPKSVAAAAADGHGLPLLMQALAELCGSPPVELSAAAAVADWWAQGRQIDLLAAPLLRTSTPDVMRRLHAEPSVAVVLGELLAPTACLLRVPLHAARRTLAQAGWPAALAESPSHLTDTPAPADETPRLAGDPLAAWVAGQVYRSIGRHLPIPFSFPQGQLDAWWAALTPTEQAAAHPAADALLAGLAELLDGVSYAPPDRPTEPTAWAQQIEQAIASTALVDLTYFSAGRNLLTRRVVEPYWLETRGSVLYLRAFCTSAGRVRLFRLDRIQSLEVLPAASNG